MSVKREDYFQFRVMQLFRYHFSRMNALLEETELYHGQPALIFALSHKDGQSQSELSHNLGIKPSTVAVMIKRMEKTEMIIRKPDETDQRILRVHLTDKGKNALKSLIKINTQLDEECLKGFTIEEKILLGRLLEQVTNNLKDVSKDQKTKDFNCCDHIK